MESEERIVNLILELKALLNIEFAALWSFLPSPEIREAHLSEFNRTMLLLAEIDNFLYMKNPELLQDPNHD